MKNKLKLTRTKQNLKLIVYNVVDLNLAILFW